MASLSTYLENERPHKTGAFASNPRRSSNRNYHVVDGSIVRLSMSDGDLGSSVFVQCIEPGPTRVKQPLRRVVRRFKSNERSQVSPLVCSDSAINASPQKDDKACYSPANNQRRILRPTSPQRKRRMQQLKQKKSKQESLPQKVHNKDQMLDSNKLKGIADQTKEIAAMRPHQRKIRWHTSLTDVQRSPCGMRIEALQLDDLSFHVRCRKFQFRSGQKRDGCHDGRVSVHPKEAGCDNAQEVESPLQPRTKVLPPQQRSQVGRIHRTQSLAPEKTVTFEDETSEAMFSIKSRRRNGLVCHPEDRSRTEPHASTDAPGLYIPDLLQV